jgi:hypothetical protein
MKKRNVLILTLALTTILSFQLAAQPQYYNHTGTTTAANSFPFQSNVGKKVQLMFQPGEFYLPTSAPQGEITAIYFLLDDGSAINRQYTSLEVKMGQTTNTQFTGNDWFSGTMEQVYYEENVTIQFSYGEWIEIQLETSFQ